LIVQAAVTIGNTAEVCCEDDGLLQGVPTQGYFMLAGDPGSLVRCVPPEACIGGAFGETNCATGYTGKRCAACQATEPKYYRRDGSCTKCHNVIPLPVLAVVAFIVLVSAAMLADTFLSKVHNSSEVLAPGLILLNFCQTMSLLVDIEIAWPPQLRHLMNALSVLNFNVPTPQICACNCFVQFMYCCPSFVV
jgi:hypothetical protein